MPHANLLARVVARLGDAEGAGTLYEMLQPHRGAVAVSQTVCVGPVARHLGLLAAAVGRLDEADRDFADAAEIADRARLPVSSVHVRLARASVLSARGAPGDAARADELLTAAGIGAARLGLALVGAEIAHLRRELTIR